MFSCFTKKIAGVFLFLLISSGGICAQNPPPGIKVTNSELKESAKEKSDDLIHFGDLIDVDVVGNTEYDWRGRLTPEGYLDGFDSVEEQIYAVCRAEKSVAADIAKILSKFLRDPQVSVKILDRSGRPESYLYGAVKNPQRMSVRREVRLNELLILAGGFTERASGEIQIVRPGNSNCEGNKAKEDSADANLQKIQPASAVAAEPPKTEIINIKVTDLLKGEEKSNPVILAGDIVTVIEAEPIYVIGGVINPQKINARAGLTVSRAVNSAGGAVKNADLKNVSIYRRAAGGTEVTDVNLEDISAGKSPDFVLKKYDIVEVREPGSAKRKTPPVINYDEQAEKKAGELPLRIIN